MDDLDRQIMTEFQKLSAEEKVNFLISLPDLLARFEAEQGGIAFDQHSVS